MAGVLSGEDFRGAYLVEVALEDSEGVLRVVRVEDLLLRFFAFFIPLAEIAFIHLVSIQKIHLSTSIRFDVWGSPWR
jgi:hypothetical protein